MGPYFVDLYDPNSGFIAGATPLFTLTSSDIQFGPTQGPVRTVVSFSAYGLQPNAKYNLSLDWVKGAMSENLTGFSTDRYGNASGSFAVPKGDIPEAYFVDVQSAPGTPVLNSSTKFTVTQTTPSVGPSFGPVNTSFLIAAPELAPNTAYTLEFDTTPGTPQFVVANFTTLYNSTFPGRFTVPSTVPAGSYSVDLFQSRNATYTTSASGPFRVTRPVVSIGPSAGPLNTSVSVSATGLAPRTSYDGYLAGVFVSNFSTAADGSYSGRFSVPQFILGGPQAGFNLYQVWNGSTPFGSFIASALSPYTVTGSAPSVSTTPASGPVGTRITLNGSGLVARTAYDVVFYGASTQTSISYVITNVSSDANGSVNATFTVPAYVGGDVAGTPGTGSYYVGLLEQNSVNAFPIETSEFNVTTSSSVPVEAAAISTTSGPRGTTVSLSGVGLPPKTRFTASLNLTPLPGVNGVPLVGFNSALNGSFRATFTIPQNASAGTYFVDIFQSASGAYNLSAQQQFTVTPTWITSLFSFGPPNSSVFLQAYGLAPNTAFRVYLDPAPGSAFYFLSSFSSNRTGGFVGSSLIPSYVPPASYFVDLWSPTSGYLVSAPGPITTTLPSLSIAPTSGPGLTSLSVSAAGLEPNRVYSLRLDANAGVSDFLVSGFSTNASGSFTGSSNITPEVPAGIYSLDLFVTTFAGPTFVAAAATPFTVTSPTLSLSPSAGTPHAGPVGCQGNLSATGLAPATAYRVSIDSHLGVPSPGALAATFTTASDGSYAGPFAVPPALAPGYYYVDVFEVTSGNFITFPPPNWFVIEKPYLALVPSSGATGKSVTALASWYAQADTSVAVTGPGGGPLCVARLASFGHEGICRFTANATNAFEFTRAGANSTVTGTGSPGGDVAIATFVGTAPTGAQKMGSSSTFGARSFGVPQAAGPIRSLVLVARNPPGPLGFVSAADRSSDRAKDRRSRPRSCLGAGTGLAYRPVHRD